MVLRAVTQFTISSQPVAASTMVCSSFPGVFMAVVQYRQFARLCHIENPATALYSKEILLVCLPSLQQMFHIHECSV